MSPCFISFLFNFLILNRIMVDNEKEEKYLCMQVVRCDSWGNNSEGKGSQGATEKSFECGICFEKFNQRCRFIEHKRGHSGKKPFSSEICEKRFSTGAILKIHKRVHSADKSFSCDFCQKKHSRGFFFFLVVHKRTHSGVKPFECNVCQMRFVDKSQKEFD